jgi:hypothetical protein
VDPRRWDLGQLLAAFEAAVKQSSKDEATWNRTYQVLTAEPKQVRDERLKAVREAALTGAERPEAPSRMSVQDAEAMLARFAASDAQFGA